MAKRNLSKAYREAMVQALGCTCVNCGSEEKIEYHHIVPLSLGGNDCLSNMVALCSRCHKAAHNGRHLSHYVNKGNSGRRRKVDKDVAYNALDLFFDGQIGNKKCRSMLGLSNSSPISASPYLKEYMADKCIADYKNTIDVAGAVTPSGLCEGRLVGHVRYTDGRFVLIYYKDTGVNDVVYKKREA